MAGAIVVAGGEGTRFGRAGGKQTALLEGRPVVAYALGAVLGSPRISAAVLVCHPARIEEYLRAAAAEDDPRVIGVAGGDTRQESVAAGLAAMPKGEDVVVVHDGARPMLDTPLLEAALADLEAHPEAAGVVVGHPLSDTVKVVGDDDVVLGTPDRSRMWAVQTPQVFRASALRDAYERARREGFTGTDDASLVERAGGVVRVLRGPRGNIKVTEPGDAVCAEALLLARREEVAG